jgi:hypothetical protein
MLLPHSLHEARTTSYLHSLVSAYTSVVRLNGDIRTEAEATARTTLLPPSSHPNHLFCGEEDCAAGGINSPAAFEIRRSQEAHSSYRHWFLRQSNSQRASSSGTSPIHFSLNHCQRLRSRSSRRVRFLGKATTLKPNRSGLARLAFRSSNLSGKTHSGM